MHKFLVSAVQAAPVYLNRDASLEKACRYIREAGQIGAKLVAFGETWLSGYPFFAWGGSSRLQWDAAQQYIEQAVLIPGPETDALCKTAKDVSIDVIIGVAELDRRTLGTTYCTMLAIGREGQILGTHRKLKPTFEERSVWGEGRGDDLNVYERPYARTSALNCWEHQMVLPGYALMAQGTQIHVAAWPGGEPLEPPTSPNPMWSRQELLSRAFAAQGGCYVIAVGGLMSADHVPKKLKSFAYEGSGDTTIIDPRGEVIARANRSEEQILICEVDMTVVRAAKAANDVAGHYSRPDVFQLLVRGEPVDSLIPKLSPQQTEAET